MKLKFNFTFQVFYLTICKVNRVVVGKRRSVWWAIDLKYYASFHLDFVNRTVEAHRQARVKVLPRYSSPRRNYDRIWWPLPEPVFNTKILPYTPEIHRKIQLAHHLPCQFYRVQNPLAWCVHPNRSIYFRAKLLRLNLPLNLCKVSFYYANILCTWLFQ